MRDPPCRSIWYPDTMALAMTLRLDDEQEAELKVVASVDEKSLSDVIREAIAEYVERRAADEEFRVRIRDRQEREKELYERLARGA